MNKLDLCLTELSKTVKLHVYSTFFSDKFIHENT